MGTSKGEENERGGERDLDSGSATLKIYRLEIGREREMPMSEF
jgi:hypothetical protein